MPAFPSVKLTYFDAAGRAESLRLAFYIGGVPFEDKRINHAEFKALKDILPLGQLPILEVDGEVLTQSQAMMRFAGRMTGLYPVSLPILALRIDELLHSLSEMEEKVYSTFQEADVEKKKAKREELASATIPHHATLFEARLEKMKRIPAFQSQDLFIHDLAIYSWVKALRAGRIDNIPNTVLDGHKILNEIHDKVANHPKVREWYTVPHNIPKLKLTYMPHPGRGEPIRLALFIGGVAFEDERINPDELTARKPSLPFHQLPVLEVDGEVISQSFAILRYAGTLSGLYPVTASLVAYRIDELFAIIDEMFYHPLWVISHREIDPKKQLAMRAELSCGIVAKGLGFLETTVSKNKDTYAVGANLTVADLAIYSVLYNFKSGIPGIPNTVASPYRNLQRVFKLVADNPKVVEWNAAHGQ